MTESSRNDSESFRYAIGLVSAGLESGSIKLRGPDTDSPETAGQIDGRYLSELIKTLAVNLQK
jgi:hypothetical protein